MRTKSAVTGKYVKRAEAKAKPRETVEIREWRFRKDECAAIGREAHRAYFNADNDGFEQAGRAAIAKAREIMRKRRK